MYRIKCEVSEGMKSNLKPFEQPGFKRYENMYKTGKGAVKI